jgi:hypothetical protein
VHTDRLPLFCDLALAERIERAEVDFIARGSAAAGRREAGTAGFVIPIAGGVASFAEIGSPLNKVAGLGFGGVPSATDLDEVERAFSVCGAPMQIELAHLVDPAIGAMLTERGYRLESFENVLGLALTDRPERATPAGIEVRPSGADEFDEWLRVMADGVAVPDVEGVPDEEFSRDVLVRALRDLAAAGSVRYAALRDGGCRRRRQSSHDRRYRPAHRRGDRACAPPPGCADRAAVGPPRRRRCRRLRSRRGHHAARVEVPAERAASRLRTALHARRSGETVLSRLLHPLWMVKPMDG